GASVYFSYFPTRRSSDLGYSGGCTGCAFGVWSSCGRLTQPGRANSSDYAVWWASEELHGFGSPLAYACRRVHRPIFGAGPEATRAEERRGGEMREWSREL